MASQAGRSAAVSGRTRNLALTLSFMAFCCVPLVGQEDSGWRISPEKINIQVGEDRPLQLLDDSAQELLGAKWFVDDSDRAELREEDGRAVLRAKAAGTVRVSAMRGGETRFREITIWPEAQALPPGTTTWGMHPIGREIRDLAAVPTEDGPHMFSLEQLTNGGTYLRAVADDGIQIWNWLAPERTHEIELVCGDWLGGALISANRADSYTLYAVGKDGKLRWQHALDGVRKGHAISLDHVVYVLSQSPEGTITKLTGFDEAAGELKFDLTFPASYEKRTNVQRAGTKVLCAPAASSSPVRTIASRLFVNIDGLAYVAFTQQEWTLSAAPCNPGKAIEPRDMSFARDERVWLWQIHPDGTHRSTIVEEFRSSRPLFEPVSVASPTGAIIPDGLGGVLLPIRRSQGDIAQDEHGSPDELIYRVNENGEVLYKFQLPEYAGPLHDEIVLGEDDRGFATRGGLLIAFNVRDGKEFWRWDSGTAEIEVFAALANGGCMVQTPTALVEADSASESKEIVKGKAMMDWQGRMYVKHD